MPNWENDADGVLYTQKTAFPQREPGWTLSSSTHTLFATNVLRHLQITVLSSYKSNLTGSRTSQNF